MIKNLSLCLVAEVSVSNQLLDLTIMNTHTHTHTHTRP
jgi:hypothetical protein